MKVTAIVTAYNENLFLDYSLRSIYDHVDEVVIIDCAMQASVSAGFGERSTDGASDIVAEWCKKDNVFLAENPKVLPKTHKECFNLGFQIAKNRGADWLFFVPGDEVWPESALKPMRRILASCEKNGILGLNVWMHLFTPDFWHAIDFRNPRFSKVTDDCVLHDDVTLYWPSKNVWQYAGGIDEPFPPGTPLAVQKVNSDYLRMLRPFHYSCVGKERVEFKAKFWQKHNGTYGDEYVEAYMKQEWDKFKTFGVKPFTGKHPKIMESHPLFNERMY